MSRAELLLELEALHQEVSQQARALEANLDLKCGLGCSDCCLDDLSVFALEAELIRAKYADLLAHGAPGPKGACAFLDGAKGCRIYEDRPYICRTQGLPLRWIDDPGTGTELRDICPLNEPSVDLLRLSADACWTLGEVEGQLATLELRHSQGLNRVALRSLFEG